jgi:hypothetical protein
MFNKYFRIKGLGCRRVNMFENRKMKTGESISGMGKGR